jgi:hypothetical protein
MLTNSIKETKNGSIGKGSDYVAVGVIYCQPFSG